MKGFGERLRITSCQARKSSNPLTVCPSTEPKPITLKEMTMNTKTNRNHVGTAIAAVLFGAVAAVASLPASADSNQAPPQVTVKYGDIDISNPQGAAALYARIRSAAKAVCPRLDERELERIAQAQACIDHAISTAVAHVNAPALSEVYAKNTGKPVPTLLAAR
jgi:UrcA family protein